MTVRQVASGFRQDQRDAVATVVAVLLSRWRRIDPSSIIDSWGELLPEVAGEVTAAQLRAAERGADYVPQIVRAQGAVPNPAGTVNAQALAGSASDGRPLETLLALLAHQTVGRVDQGMPSDQALRQGGRHMGMMAATQVMDAGRLASSVGMVADRTLSGYRRQLTPPSCGRCAVLAGKWFRWNRGFQRHPRCFPAGVVVSGPKALASTRRWYEGELVVLTTASGEDVALTGNHPVLTRRGWVPANLLQEGDDVVRSTRPEGAAPLVVPDHHEVPSLVEDVWGSLRVGGLDRVPSAAEDFHGDGRDGEVDVVYADSALRGGLDAAGLQPVGEEHLAIGVVGAPALSVQGVPQLVDLRHAAETGGAVGGGGLGPALAGGHALRAGLACLAHAAPLDAGLGEDASDGATGHAVLAGQGVLAGAVEVGRDDLLGGQQPPLATRWDAPPLPFGVETRGRYASTGRDLLQRLAGQVEPDRVVELRRVEWSGHVYSLTSSEGWHTANSLIVSNCDCVHVPATGPKSDLGGLETFDPHGYFESLSPEEQAKHFTKAGAQAIRDGGDMGQVVNARRGLRSTVAYGQKISTTTVGTARGSSAARIMRQEIGGEFHRQRGFGPRSQRRLNVPRLTPEQIYADARGRDDAIRLLGRFGYLDG